MRTRMSEEERLRRRKASWAKYSAANREKLRANARHRYSLNKEGEKARHKKWASANLERLREYEHRRYRVNPEPKKARVKAWRDKNPEYNQLACLLYQIRVQRL